MPYRTMMTTNDRGRPPLTKSTPSSFGAWLKDQRIKRGWSSERMAEELGLSQGAVSLYERGARHPKREKVVQIALSLGANPQEALDALVADTPGLATLADVQTPDTVLREFDLLTPEEQLVIAGVVSSLLRARGARS
jgi:transcriptional regulator with XRE-family HTH domain